MEERDLVVKEEEEEIKKILSLLLPKNKFLAELIFTFVEVLVVSVIVLATVAAVSLLVLVVALFITPLLKL